MAKVQRAPCWGALLGVALLPAAAVAVPLSAAGWTVGVLCSVVSAFLVQRGLRIRRMPRFGPANAVTSVRAALVGLAAAYAVTALTQPVPAAVVVAVVVPAIALDGVDGWVARRARCESELGARYDMEVDAFLLLVLGLLAGPRVGWWVLAIGLMRYAFVAAGWALPWLRAPLPPRYWRKVVTGACGTALIAAASDLLPQPAGIVLVAAALGLLVESFGRDVVWLIRLRPARPLPAARRRAEGAGVVARPWLPAPHRTAGTFSSFFSMTRGTSIIGDGAGSEPVGRRQGGRTRRSDSGGARLLDPRAVAGGDP